MNIIDLSKNVLIRLSEMDNETKGGYSTEQLIFPQKAQANGTKLINRISEQELRLLFIEEFKKDFNHLFYSVETPTEEKYKFGENYKSIVQNVNIRKTSASLDMCIFERISDNYKRILNIEFKHKKCNDKNIGKDILKLLRESQDGAFIHLLNNTDRGTFCNKGKTGIFDIFHKSFLDLKSNWNNEDKTIHLIILSLEQKNTKSRKPFLIHCKIGKSNLDNSDNIFCTEKGCGNITEIEEREWKIENLID